MQTDIIAKDTNQANTQNYYDCVVIGGGVAGVAACIYLARANKKFVLITDSIGGQLQSTKDLENYPGFYGPAKTFINNLSKQLEIYKVPIIHQKALAVEDCEYGLKIKLNNNEVYTKYAIIATGSKYNTISFPSLLSSQFYLNNIHYCALCDGFAYNNMKVAIMGGGDSAFEAAIDLATRNEVTVFNRSNVLKASEWLQNKAKSQNVKILMSKSIADVQKTETGLDLYIRNNITNEIEIQHYNGLFICIGLIPNSDTIDVQKDSAGYIIADINGTTSNKRILVAGDIISGSNKQAIVSAGSGTNAAIYVITTLNKEL